MAVARTLAARKSASACGARMGEKHFKADTHTNARTQTNAHAHTRAHTHTRTRTRARRDMHTYARSHTHTLARTRAHARAHAQTQTRTHPQTHTHRRTRTPMHTHTAAHHANQSRRSAAPTYNVNCSGCRSTNGLQICRGTLRHISLSSSSFPSSSQLQRVSDLSLVSSGNHCRSDPVQVQSTIAPSRAWTMCALAPTNGLVQARSRKEAGGWSWAPPALPSSGSAACGKRTRVPAS